MPHCITPKAAKLNIAAALAQPQWRRQKKIQGTSEMMCEGRAKTNENGVGVFISPAD